MDEQKNQPFDAVRKMPCVLCSQPVEYYNGADAVWFGCAHCKTFFAANPQGHKELLRSFSYEQECIPDLPLGSIGVLDEVSYVVTAFMKKREYEDGYPVLWNEYMLYNKDHGYVTLVDFSGHWMLVKPVTETPVVRKITYQLHVASYKETNYNLYHSYTFDILFAAGAFDENILLNEKMHTWEYTAPPQMVINERLKGVDTWYHGRYLVPSDIETAFGLRRRSLPKRIGVGVIEPSPYTANRGWLSLFSVIMVVLAIITGMVFSRIRPNSIALRDSYAMQPDSAAKGNLKPVVTVPFELPTQGSVEVELQARLNNEWLETSVSLINDNNGSTYDFSKTLESYSGVDDGEAGRKAVKTAARY